MSPDAPKYSKYVNVDSVEEAIELIPYLPDPTTRKKLIDYMVDYSDDIWGDDTSYHRLISLLIDRRDYRNAFRLCGCALAKFESCDLLADAIDICNKGGQLPKCRTYLNRAYQLDMSRWSLRLFTCCLEYHITGLRINSASWAENLNRGLSLADDFIRYFPESEDGYLCKAKLLFSANQREDAFRLLAQYVIHDSAVSPIDAPKCRLLLWQLLQQRTGLPFETGADTAFFDETARVLRRQQANAQIERLLHEASTPQAFPIIDPDVLPTPEPKETPPDPNRTNLPYSSPSDHILLSTNRTDDRFVIDAKPKNLL